MNARRLAWLALIAVTACGDNNNASRKLTITDPVVMAGTVTQLCLGDDRDNSRAGVQFNVRVVAEGFADGDQVLLVLDGHVDPQLAQRVTGGQVIFSLFTIPDGSHSLAAYSQDQSVRSEPVPVVVNSTPADVQIVSPLGGATIPGPLPAMSDVQIFADVEDGQTATMTLTPPSGRTKTSTAMLAAKRATIRATFDELGAWKVRVDAKTKCGNPGFATIDVGVGTPPPVPCVVEITPTPRSIAGLPYPVLNYALDPDHNAPGFQATVKVHSTIGNTADLFLNLVSTGGGPKTVVDDGSGNGIATFTIDLPEATDHLQAQCRDRSSNVATSLDNVVIVDVTNPACSVLSPADMQMLTPANDTDGNPANGTQFAINTRVVGTGTPSDTQGEVATITLGAAAQTTSVAGDSASVVGTLNAPANNIPVTIAGQDHAGNTCTATVHVSYVTQGCPIAWVSPTGIVTTDSNPGTTGVQSPVTVSVDAACAGRQVSLTNCDVNTSPLTTNATNGANPTATFNNVTLCSLDSCPRSTRQCTASVTNAANITTSVTQTVSVQTQPPQIGVSSFLPGGACGSAVTAQADQNGNIAGTQIKVRVTGIATTLWAEDSPQGSNPAMIPTDTNGIAEVTLSDGANAIVGKGTDDSGLTGTSPPCNVTLATLALSITQPANGATLGRADGTVSGSNLTTQVCGTVGSPATAAVQVWIDSNMAGAVSAAINPGTGAWCASVPIAEGNGRVVHALGTAGTNQGSAAITVNVDLTAPGDPTNLTFASTRRNTLQVGWTAPSDGGAAVARCEVRQYTGVINAGNFDVTPRIATVPGASPGTVQNVTASPLKTGRNWFFGVRCYDAANNPSNVLANGTPQLLKMKPSATLSAAAVPGFTLNSTEEFGFAATGADLNGDGFSDLIVSAPNACSGTCSGGIGQGLVYVYMGGPTGVSATPAFAIKGTDASTNEWLGRSLATLDWNHDGVQDIVVGAPGASGFQGKVFIYFGQAGSASRWTPPSSGITVFDDGGTTTGADVTISLDQSDLIFRGRTDLGSSLAALDFDNDGHADLAIGAPAAGNFDGGVIVLYAPTGSSFPKTLALPGGLGTGAGQTDTSGLAFTFTGAVQDGGEYGSHIATLSDVSNDGRADLIVGTQPSDFTGAYAVDVRVFYGRQQSVSRWTTAAHTTANLVLVSPQTAGANETFGETMASISDQSGDGKREIVVSDFKQSKTYIVSGALTGTQAVATSSLLTLDGQYMGSGMGNPANKLGSEIDGDSQDDLVLGFGLGLNFASLGIWFGCDTPTGVCLTGAPTSVTDAYTGPSAFTDFITTAWVGDLNGDGLADVLWSDSRSRSGSAGPGSAQVLY